jgi:phosphoribosyl-ATP pyrophosphohydrolase/phosphoribosyl-AMP cyclohydrolase
MVAWMDAEAERLTRQTGEVHFWSRSRRRLWKKGEESGHVLRLVEMKLDCDEDTWLVRVLPVGPSCHTGAESCFGTDGVEPPSTELHQLEATIRARLVAPAGTRSYVRSLVEDETGGKVAAKITEEAAELVAELVAPSTARERVVSEAADLLFHTLVGLLQRGISLEEVEAELSRRAGLSGLDEKAARTR